MEAFAERTAALIASQQLGLQSHYQAEWSHLTLARPPPLTLTLGLPPPTPTPSPCPTPSPNPNQVRGQPARVEGERARGPAQGMGRCGEMWGDMGEM